jgi:hypothetical protein
MVELVAVKSDRLQAAFQRAEEVATRRDIPVEDWLAEAIEWKNELNAGSLVDERYQ